MPETPPQPRRPGAPRAGLIAAGGAAVIGLLVFAATRQPGAPPEHSSRPQTAAANFPAAAPGNRPPAGVNTPAAPANTSAHAPPARPANAPGNTLGKAPLPAVTPPSPNDLPPGHPRITTDE